MNAARTERIQWMSGIRPWARLSPPSRRLITAGALLLQIMVVAVSLSMWSMRNVALHIAGQNEQILSLALGEQTSRSVQAVDLVLQETQKEIAAQGITTPATFRAALETQAVYRKLSQESSGLPQADAFSIIGADGKLVNFSRHWPVPPLNLADRDYYKYFKTHDDKAVYISLPLRNRDNGKWTVYLIRRVNSPSGQFLGLLLGAINLHYFDNFYQSLSANDGLTVYLLQRNGAVLATYPATTLTGRIWKRPNPSWLAIIASGQPGAYEAPGVLTPGQRLNAIDPLADYPLVVNVTMSKSAVLANWRKQAWMAADGSVSAMFCAFLLLRALTQQLQRLEHSEATLAEQNAALIKIEAEISYIAHHDDLTKLMNRRAFHQLLDQALERASRSRRVMAILYLDLDRFKIVNDTRGHDFGDKLLVLLAARLRQAVGGIDTVARTGGDKFAIIRPVIKNTAELQVLAQSLLHAVREPFEVEGMQCHIGLSIGIASYPAHGKSSGDLLRNADMALYQAKADGGDVYCIFDESMNTRQQQLYAIEQGLRQAIELQQFELNYQPILETASGKIAACEALVRWRHPERGLIPPMDFIGLAERLGLIIPIGYWIFETACMEANTWPAVLSITINLSPVQFRDENLFDKLSEILQRTGFAPNRLIFEITEGVLLEESSRVIGIMGRLRGLGIRFTLDDFGTGHSGLGYLRQFPFDGIKIDKIFVHDMEHQPEARAIVAALLAVSTALNLDVIAEGVENEAQLAELRRLGCKHVQGYLIGRPKSRVEIQELLNV